MAEHTYAVIGSNCFTGSHLVDRLLEDPSNFVAGFSRSQEKSALFLPYKRRGCDRFKFFQIDLFRQADRLAAFLDELKPRTVIFMAALSEVGLSNFQPIEYFQTNTLGVIQRCHHLKGRRYLERYIHISSAEVYGSCARPLPESAALNPSTPYAVSKAAADLYLMTLFKNFNFPAILIRSTNVYGRHQQLYKIIPRTIIYLKKGERLDLHGGGKAVKTWVHVRDVADGIMRAMEQGRPGEIYHFSDRHSYSIACLVRKICEMMNCEYEASVVPAEERLGEDSQYLLDYSKAEHELGWTPHISFQQGIEETIAWIEENWNGVMGESLVYTHQA